MQYAHITNGEAAYLDVRVCFNYRSRLHNVHLLAILMKESQTGLFMFDLVSQTLEAKFGSLWKLKILSVTTDGANNMTGGVQEDVNPFQGICIPGGFRIWCAHHQLDLGTRKVLTS